MMTTLWLCCYAMGGRGGGGVKLQQIQQPLHTHLARPTSVECSTTEDCRDHFSHRWCQSGVFCSRGRCHTIPSYPCKAEERCDEASHKCVEKPCKNWKDCDDGLFCNGVERCVASVCRSDHRFDCTHGQCSEATQTCATPLSLKQEAERMASSSSGGNRVRKSGGIYIMDEPTAAPTNSTSTDNSVVYWTMFGVAAAVFGAGAVLFIILSLRGGSGSDPYLIVINNGNGGEYGEDPESNFQQQLHYSNQY